MTKLNDTEKTAISSNGVCVAVADSQQKVEPCIIQSAFLLDNGKRIIVYTGALGIVSYECDESWKPYVKPFATCPKEMMSESPTEYHTSIRKMHGEEKLMKEHSTEIDW